MKARHHEDPEAERAVLASILIRPQGMAEIADRLSSTDFQDSAYAELFAAMFDLYLDKKPIDPVTLAPKIKRPGVLERLGGQDGLLRLAEEEPTGIHVRDYADRIIHASAMRKTLQICRSICSEPENMMDILRRAAGEADDPRLDHALVSFVSARLGISTDSWPDPEPLPDELRPVQQFSPKLLPRLLRRFVLDIARRMQCPIDFPAIGIIIVLATVLGRKIAIRPKRHDDWTVVSNLWGGVVGRPSMLKSPALQEAMTPLTRLELQSREQYRDELKQFEVDQLFSEEIGKARRREMQKSCGDPSRAREIAQQVIDETPNIPIRRRYVVNDTSVEKLGEILGDNPNGVLVFRDEVAGFFRSLDKIGQESSRAFYLEAWSGSGRFTWDRIGRGTVEIESAIVSILGTIQPGPLKAYVRQAVQDGAGNDGLLQRFQLLVWPDADASWRNVDRPPNLEARREVADLLRRFDQATAADFRATECDRDPDSLPFLRFAPEAQVRFDEWRENLENRLRTGDDHPAIESHLTKYRSLVPSIALVLHLADEGYGPVSLAALEHAFLWAEYLETHARRVYGACLSLPVSTAHRIREKILNHRIRAPFSARDVYRPQWSGLTQREEVEAGLALLVDCDWIRPIVRRAGKSRTLYLINPKIYEMAKKGTDNPDRRPPEGSLSALSVPSQGISPDSSSPGPADPAAKPKADSTCAEDPTTPGSRRFAETPSDPDGSPNPSVNPPPPPEQTTGTSTNGKVLRVPNDVDFYQTTQQGTDNADTDDGLVSADDDASTPDPDSKNESAASIHDDESLWPGAQP